jgi:hypothetical protein
LFEPSKLEDSTQVRILIEWTPKLRALVVRLKSPPPQPTTMGKAKLGQHHPCLHDAQGGALHLRRDQHGLDARPRSGQHFHDLRAKALTDVDDKHDIKAARGMGGHSTQSQTADYICHKKARKVSATR